MKTKKIPVQRVHTDALEEAQTGAVVAASLIEAKVKQGEGRSGAPKLVEVKVEHEIVQKQCITQKSKWVKTGEIELLVFDDPEVAKINTVDSEEEDAACDENPIVPGTDCLYSHSKHRHYTGVPMRFTLKYVYVYSTGLGFEGCIDQTSFAETAQELDARVHTRLKSLMPIHLFMDCRQFDPPHLSEHDGTDNAVAQFIDNKHFAPWLKEVNSALNAFENDPEMPNRYAIMC